MRINNNIMAMNTYRQLGITNSSASKSMEKLSSGLRINRAGDDAAGLSISEKMRAQIRGLNMASKNAQDGISLIQTAEGALQETHSILQRMRELAVQSANDTNVEIDRSAIQAEIDELAKEITRIANNTEFNTQKLINGGITNTKFHVGANEGQDIELAIKAMDAFSLGVAGVSTTADLTGTGSVTDVTVTGYAAAVEDGNVITASIDEVTQTIQEAAKLEGGSYDTSVNLSSAANTTLTISIDGTDYEIDDFSGWDGSGNVADLINLLNSAEDSDGNKLGNVITISDDGEKLTLTTKTQGASSSITVNITGQNVDGVVQLIGISNGSSAMGTETTSTTYTLTLSDGVRENSVITGLAANATVAVGTGDFAGFTLTLDGSLADGDTNIITLSVTKGSAAEFAADGSLISEAITEAGIDVSTQAAASSAITTIQTAIEKVSAERSKLGAYQNRLEHTIKNLDTSAENLQASESRIRDVDMAKEMMEFTKQNILQQAATAMLAQANQAPQSVLQLLR